MYISKQQYLIFNILAIWFFSVQALSQISITSGTTSITQDFNTLANSGSSSDLPMGWSISESGSSADAIYSAGTGSSSIGNSYSFGLANNTERALGGLRSGSLTPSWGICFTNNTGNTITSFRITYKGETWRVGTSSRSDSILFEYNVNTTSITGSGTWTRFPFLNYFNTPKMTSPLSGNVQDSALITSILSGLTIANGTSFCLRWIDFDASGSDDGMAIDDFTIDNFETSTSTCDFANVIPNNVTVTNSTCSAPSCNASGGLITAPSNSNCPTGSTLQYSSDRGVNWGTIVPVYDQSGPPQAIITRCNCNADNTVSSPSSDTVRTNPGSCNFLIAIIEIKESSGTTSDDGIICAGAGVTLTATGGSSYIWSTSAETNAIMVNPTAETIYTVTVTDNSGCTDTESFVIRLSSANCTNDGLSQSISNCGQTGTENFNSYQGTALGIPLGWTTSSADFDPGGYYSNSTMYSSSNSTYGLGSVIDAAYGAKVPTTGVESSNAMTYCMTNNTGLTIDIINVSWEVEQYSIADRATTVDLSYNINGGIFGQSNITGISLTTAQIQNPSSAPDANLTNILITQRNVFINTSVPTGQQFCLRMTIASGVGVGANAHIGFDNFSVTTNCAQCNIPNPVFENKTFTFCSDETIDIKIDTSSKIIIQTWNFEDNITSPAISSHPEIAEQSDAPIIGSIDNSISFQIAGSECSNAISASNWVEPSLTNAIIKNNYIEFSTGRSVYNYLGTNNIFWSHRRSGTGPTNWALVSSIDPYTIILSDTFSTSNCEIAGGAIPLNTSNKFRIYYWGATSSSGNIRIDNLILTAEYQPDFKYNWYTTNPFVTPGPPSETSNSFNPGTTASNSP